MKKLSFSLLSMAAAMILATVPACSIKEDLTPDTGEGVVLRFFSEESKEATQANAQRGGGEDLKRNEQTTVW